MAVWVGLGQAATVAQLVGVDAGGLISAILHAAATARRNKKECDQLAHRVLIIAELLKHIHGPEVIQWPLAGLEEALREAHDLVVSCQGQSAAYRFVMAGRQARMFRDVHARLDMYISVFPLVSHIAMTRRLDRIQHPNDYITTTVRPVSDEVRHGPEEHLSTFAAAAATNNQVAAGGAGATSTVVVRRLFTDWCAEMEKRLLPFRRRQEADGMLVCQYVNHGTLRDHLQHRSQSSSSSPVTTSWRMRVEVLLRTSRAIEQNLHCSTSVMHGRHVSSSTIILDASWRPRISDKVGAGGMNINSPPPPTTSDIMHNFGEVMLEVLTGSPPSDAGVVASSRTSGEHVDVSLLVAFALPFVEAGQLAQVLDRRPTPQPTPRQLLALEQVAQTAVRCLQVRAEDRPPILDVVANLERALNLILPTSIL